MSEYKISIIIPVYNAEDNLRRSFESIIDQTMNLEDIQVIVVNDASTDSSLEIIDSYCNKYTNFHCIHLKENIGAAFGPRNIGLNEVKGDYLMFLDADDCYEKDTCKVLYDKIVSNNLDIVFGRYKRIFDKINVSDKNKHYFNKKNQLIQKSHSAFKDDLIEFSDDIYNNPNLNGFIGFLWEKIFARLIYGKIITNPESSDNCFSEINLEYIADEVNILKSLPSFWTKIYKSSLILDNDIRFPEVISAEDLNFLMEAYFKAEGICYLNDKFVYNYYMGDNESSITKNITYKLVLDSLKGYMLCSNLCNDYEFNYSDIILNPFLLNWISLYKNANLSDVEKNSLLKEVKLFKKSYNSDFIGKLLCYLMIFLVKYF
ncbi:MAG: glycosyltransferase family 2 protein [Methanobacteriaceae archaeon]|nr:glycosyltransferase family 2 protein [Methanobacteriaceae archaeon]